MRLKINNYTFNKTNRTVTFTDYTSIRLDGISYISNITRNVIIYVFSSPALGGSVIDNVVTLDYDTSLMDDTDKLEIYYDDEDTNQATDEGVLLLRRIAKLLEGSSSVDRNNRQRITIDGITLNSSGDTLEATTTIPVLPNVNTSGLLGYQAGAGYGQPVLGTNTGITTTVIVNYTGGTNTIITGITTFFNLGTPYLTNTNEESWYQMGWEGPVDQRWRVAEDSHLTYQTRIRSKLDFY